MTQTTALIIDESIVYPLDAPFDPGERYPELERLGAAAGPPNRVYAAVRELFLLLGLDKDRAGTPQWNPFADFIRPGARILIKPNLVLHEMKHCVGSHCVTTHGSVIRPIIDYCALAAGPDAEITIGDVPLQSADFDRVVESNGLRALVDHCARARGWNVKLVDMRPMRQIATEDFFFEQTVRQEGDPRGYTVVDLDGRSWLEPLCEGRSPRFTVTDYDAGETREHHRRGLHQYCVCNSALDADVFINVPKLKTHEKAGVTVNLKNLVGINGQKDWLPHFRKGSVLEGGDEWNKFSLRKTLHSKARALLQGRHKILWNVARAVWHLLRPPKSADAGARTAAEFFETGGAWYGNDTVWRMVLDLNAIMLHYSRERGWCEERPRQYFYVVDGVVAGERHGPLFPTPKHAGCLMAGFEPVAGDMVAAHIMGFDWERIPLLREALRSRELPLTSCEGPEDIFVVMREGLVPMSEIDRSLGFVPAPGWRGVIERRASAGLVAAGSTSYTDDR